MNRNHRRLPAIIAGLLTLALVAVTGGGAAADPDPDTFAQPNGPWVTPQQTVSLEAFTDYEQLTRTLTGIDERSAVVDVVSIGTSTHGRDIWLARIGDPSNTPVMIITQQHGDEPHGTEAAMHLIQWLGTNSAAAREILDELYVLIVPRVNPDGSTIPERGNTDFSAPLRNSRSCFGSDGTIIGSRLDQGRGVFTTDLILEDGTELWSYDVNRYHWMDWTDSWQIQCNPGLSGVHFDPAQNPVPEAVAVVETYKTYQPIWMIDVHNQDIDRIAFDADPDGPNRPGRRHTSSVLWPTNTDVDPAAVDFSKQLALTMKLASLEKGFSEMDRYNGGSFPGIARNAYGLAANERIAAGETNVGGSVLVEISGQTEGTGDSLIGQKAIGMLNNEARLILSAALTATADGSIYELDPNLVDELILDVDEDLDNPHTEEE